MTKVVLLFTVLFGMPILFEACCRGEYIYYLSYSDINTKLINETADFYTDGDTISSDSINMQMVLVSSQVADNYNQLINPYNSIACSPHEEYRYVNLIIDISFGTIANGNFYILNNEILNSLKLSHVRRNYNWSTEKTQFISDLRNHKYEWPDKIVATFLSPHNKENVQFAVWAIKENGDTLKSIGPKVFCQ